MDDAPLLGHPETRPTRDAKFYLQWLLRFCIFGVTGSSSVAVTRAILHHLFNLQAGSWSYLCVFFVAELFVYSIMLFLIGTILGQWRFFSMVLFKMWGWALSVKTREKCRQRLQEE
ncbi:uncharacterized protein BYT42DRAFT_549968 [Radiomyces spectabilis]|uniref:uncharacterized protein n=1 Tax=Radiomyces spectabilis TaxID=64574 RepID=UPI00221F6EEE|nr:uncharacterized protein BYT42DRAFT_549968 [Radiomyces spectabilis]KAI8365977.1 hypothetical protein BYT42DRAFT_549968 [Radiomyces spectabilis]